MYCVLRLHFTNCTRAAYTFRFEKSSQFRLLFRHTLLYPVIMTDARWLWRMPGAMKDVRCHDGSLVPWRMPCDYDGYLVSWRMSGAMTNVRCHYWCLVPWLMPGAMTIARCHDGCQVPWRMPRAITNARSHYEFYVPWRMPGAMTDATCHYECLVPRRMPGAWVELPGSDTQCWPIIISARRQHRDWNNNFELVTAKMEMIAVCKQDPSQSYNWWLKHSWVRGRMWSGGIIVFTA